jgi:glycosyltransferase involved in cell wall biosynthesis
MQVHTLPDTLVFAAVIPRISGSRVLLDLHECMPEFFATKFGLALGHPMVRTLGALERAAIRYADRAITCTEEMRAAFVSRGAPASRIDVVLNAADERLFDPSRHPPRAPDGRFVLICHGALEERYGLDTLIQAVDLLATELPDLQVEIYGEGSQRQALRSLVRRLGLEARIRFSDGYVPIDDLVAAIGAADAGVVAVRRDPFRDLTHCNKMYDFVAMKRPVLASRTVSAEAYFGEESFAWFESGDPASLAVAIRKLHDDPAWAARLVACASRRGEPYRWHHQERAYLASVDRALASVSR